MQSLILLLASYILGSFPSGYLVGRLVKGIDIRKEGSGSTGATNVNRLLGKKWAIVVFVLDFLKGFAAPSALKFFAPHLPAVIIVLAAIAPVCGHNWSIFLGFKGGKGVATSLGGVAGLSLVVPGLWIVLLAAVITWLVVFYISRYVSVASLAAGAVFTATACLLYLPKEIKIFSLVLYAFIVLRHLPNIKRLLTNSEYKFKK